MPVAPRRAGAGRTLPVSAPEQAHPCAEAAGSPRCRRASSTTQYARARAGDGRYLLSNAKDQTAKLWDLRRMRNAAQHARLPPARLHNFEWDYRCGAPLRAPPRTRGLAAPHSARRGAAGSGAARPGRPRLAGPATPGQTPRRARAGGWTTRRAATWSGTRTTAACRRFAGTASRRRSSARTSRRSRPPRSATCTRAPPTAPCASGARPARAAAPLAFAATTPCP